MGEMQHTPWSNLRLIPPYSFERTLERLSTMYLLSYELSLFVARRAPCFLRDFAGTRLLMLGFFGGHNLPVTNTSNRL